MATTAAAELSPPNGTINFPNMLSGKRRRMRSGGGVSTRTNNSPKTSNEDQKKAAETASKCKGATTIPIFLKKTYKMIDTCDPDIATWTPDGEMFVVKNPDLFAAQVIPQYFDHNKFSSFARQLNFYGFRKMQAKPIRNADFDTSTAKHVTFYNEKFKRGRCDLLKEIQRSTRGGGSNSNLQEHQREVEALKKKVGELETTIKDMKLSMEERMRKLELDMLGQMEQMMIAMQQNQQMQQQRAVSGGVAGMLPGSTWEPLSMDPSKRTSTIGSISSNAPIVSTDSARSTSTAKTAATLPPHPKQKQAQVAGLPSAMTLPSSRLNSLRGFSRGSFTRGMSVESSSSAVLMRNSWEDKFFSMLMLGESEASAAAAANAATGAAGTDSGMSGVPMSDAAVEAALASMATTGTTGAEPAAGDANMERAEDLSPTRSLSPVSTSDLQ